MTSRQSLYDQLVNIKSRPFISSDEPKHKPHYKNKNTRAVVKKTFMEPYQDVMMLINDGEDHINIWAGATTELGKILDHNGPLPLNHSYFNNFDSMTAFWYYIRSKERDDRIRAMRPTAAYRFGKSLTLTRVSNFKAIIGDSNWQRIKANKSLTEMIKKSTLPFDCYFVLRDTGMRRRPSFFGWLLWSFEEIRSAIKEGREPDFSSLLDVTDSGIYDFVLPKHVLETIKNKTVSITKDPDVISNVKQNVSQ
jgi:hypothetical protein